MKAKLQKTSISCSPQRSLLTGQSTKHSSPASRTVSASVGISAVVLNDRLQPCWTIYSPLTASLRVSTTDFCTGIVTSQAIFWSSIYCWCITVRCRGDSLSESFPSWGRKTFTFFQHHFTTDSHCVMQSKLRRKDTLHTQTKDKCKRVFLAKPPSPYVTFL